MKSKFRLTMVVALFVASSSAYAIRESNPPWVTNPTDPQWAGGATTSQGWEFGGGNITTPAYFDNIYGVPQLTVRNGSPQTVPGPMGPPIDGAEVMTWHIDEPGGGIDLFIPNNPRPNARKVIWIQWTSDKGALLNGVSSDPAGAVTYPGPIIGYPPTPGNPDAWYTYSAQIEIPFNPPYEIISIDFPASTNIEEVHVDTICVPEPGVACLIGLGAALTLLRRRSA